MEEETNPNRTKLTEYYNRAIQTYQESYEDIRKDLEARFPEAEEKTIHARTLDCTRNFLPAGVPTNLIIYTDARTISELISQLLAGGANRRRIGYLIYYLLTGEFHRGEGDSPLRQLRDRFVRAYKPEAKRLVRHTEPDFAQREFIESLAQKTKSLQSEDWSEVTYWLSVNRTLEELDISISQLLEKGLSLSNHFRRLNKDTAILPPVLFKFLSSQLHKFGDKSQLGAIGQSGAINFDGVANLGVLRDLNRHRSTERFFPILEDNDKSPIYMPRRLDFPEFLMVPPKDYIHHWNRTINYQNRLRKLIENARQCEFVHGLNKLNRYILPLGYPTRYFIGMSLSDLIYIASLRTKPGGHIEYREEVIKWVKRYEDYLKGCSGYDGISDLFNYTPINTVKDFSGRA